MVMSVAPLRRERIEAWISESVEKSTVISGTARKRPDSH